MSLPKLTLLVSRLGVYFALSFLLFLATYARLSNAFPPAAMFLYGAHLSVVASSMLFGFSALLHVVERHTRRGRLISTLLALLLLAPLIHYVAAHVAAGDGLRARGIPEVLSTSVAVFALVLLVTLVWTYRFWARRRIVDVLLGLVAVGLLLFAEAHLSRAQTQLATLLQVAAIFVGAEVAMILLGDESRALRSVGLSSAALGVVFLLAGLCLPQLVQSGRRRALVAESSIAYVDARVFGAARSARAPALTRAQCGKRERAPALLPLALPDQQRRNVILVSIDSLRADTVYQRVRGERLMPALTGFAEESAYAPRAQTAFPATLLAMTSAFTGAMPSDLLLAPKPLKNLFTLTRSALDAVEAVLPKGRYFTRPDVQAYLLSGAHSEAVGSARQQTAHAMARLDELRAEGKRHLMWIHYFDPHSPYELRDAVNFGDSALERYRSELAYVDGQLARLLDFLRKGGWYEDSLIMVFADHGESFGEHDHYFHHYLVYPWLVNVPLVWHAPGGTPRRVDAPVHLMDIAPTVLHFLNLPIAPVVRGMSLLAGDPPENRVLLSEEISISGRMMFEYRTSPARDAAELFGRLVRLENGPGYASKLGVRSGEYYLVQHRASLATELYAWRSDPRALHDLADRDMDTVRRLDAAAERFRSDVLERAFCDLPLPP